jgi:hypothetical protein
MQSYNAQALVDAKQKLMVQGEVIGWGQDHYHVELVSYCLNLLYWKEKNLKKLQHFADTAKADELLTFNFFICFFMIR